MPFRDILRFWNRAKQGGRKSFRYEEINRDYLVRPNGNALLHYLEALQKDLDEREEIN